MYKIVWYENGVELNGDVVQLHDSLSSAKEYADNAQYKANELGKGEFKYKFKILTNGDSLSVD